MLPSKSADYYEDWVVWNLFTLEIFYTAPLSQQQHGNFLQEHLEPY
jgi:hypothetical protein